MTPTEQPQDVQQGGFPMNTNSSLDLTVCGIPLLRMPDWRQRPEVLVDVDALPEDSRSALTANDGAYCVGDSRQK